MDDGGPVFITGSYIAWRYPAANTRTFKRGANLVRYMLVFARMANENVKIHTKNI